MNRCFHEESHRFVKSKQHKLKLIVTYLNLNNRLLNLLGLLACGPNQYLIYRPLIFLTQLDLFGITDIIRPTVPP